MAYMVVAMIISFQGPFCKEEFEQYQYGEYSSHMSEKIIQFQ
jgi:hypothetical protein